MLTETTILGRLHLECDRAGNLEIAHYTPRSLITREDGSVASFTDQPLVILGAENSAALLDAIEAYKKLVKEAAKKMKKAAGVDQ